MRSHKGLIGSIAAAIVIILTISSQAVAQQERVIHSFNSNGSDGNIPAAGLIFDNAGNLYGTTQYGGTGSCSLNGYMGCGTIFKMAQLSNGRWTEKIIYSFINGNDGRYPKTSLIFDDAGNLYGTTAGGGIYGYGTAFELIRGAGGIWAETVLHNFNQDGTDGTGPSALTLDAAGNLYGTTFAGGANASGIAFELTPMVGGNWSESIIHTFGCSVSHCIDGYYPTGGLVLDSQGRLYGVTQVGGEWGGGTAFQLTLTENGGWVETTIHGFGRPGDGMSPIGNLIFDSFGNLYGLDQQGGSISGDGTAFELIASGSGFTSEKILHNFSGEDVFYPEAGLVFDNLGNLYGTSVAGGIYISGSVFKLVPVAGGSWTETVLHQFGAGNDGQSPAGALAVDSHGNLYGTTAVGGQHAWGTVFEITP